VSYKGGPQYGRPRSEHRQPGTASVGGDLGRVADARALLEDPGAGKGGYRRLGGIRTRLIAWTIPLLARMSGVITRASLT
jgi:hypothetical protein